MRKTLDSDVLATPHDLSQVRTLLADTVAQLQRSSCGVEEHISPRFVFTGPGRFVWREPPRRPRRAWPGR